MWIAWNTAALWALGLVAFGTTRRGDSERWLRTARAAARELALVLSLYAVWRWVHQLTVRQVTGADRHARWVWHTQRWLHLPSEASFQHAFLGHPWLVQFGNGYYALVHGPALIVTLVWLYARHRSHYPRVRNALAIVTGVCLVIRLFPVAPPRLLPDLGFVDTGLRYGQSVYGSGTGGLSNQLAAMPSVHVAWALLVAVAVVAAGHSRWRWLVVAHPVLTVYAVTVTANHWWLDGIVAAGLVWAALAVHPVLRRLAGHVARPPGGGPVNRPGVPASDPA